MAREGDVALEEARVHLEKGLEVLVPGAVSLRPLGADALGVCLLVGHSKLLSAWREAQLSPASRMLASTASARRKASIPAGTPQ